MTRILRPVSTVCSLALIAALALGCNSKPSPSAPGSSHGMTSAIRAKKLAPADMSVHARIVHGVLKVKTPDGSWQPLAAGASLDHVSTIRSLGKGAVVALSDPRGGPPSTVWLRGGTSLELWRADSGLAINVVEGQARVHATGGPVYVMTSNNARDSAQDIAQDIRGRDVMVYKRDADAEVALVDTRGAAERAAWSVALEGEPTPAGFGALEVRAPEPDADGTDDAGDAGDRDRNIDRRTLLELRRVHVDVESAGDYAYTQVEHVFYNPSDTQLEGTFRFPLPEGAMPLGLAMEINGRLMEGELVERDKARKTYESIVDQMQDPALLEWQQGQNFKLRVFPIEAMSEKRVILRYASPLAPTIDGWEYVYPSFAPSMQGAIADFRLRFDGRIIVEREHFTAGEDVIVPMAPAAVPTVTREVVDAARDVTGGRVAGVYTAVRIAPDWSQLGVVEERAADTDRVATGLTIIVDTSRSALESRDIALETLGLVLGELDARDRFTLMTADIETRVHNAEPTAVTSESTAAALAAVRAIEPDGASDLGAAFARAAELVAASERAGLHGEILYIGDGTPTWGTTEPSALAGRLENTLSRSVVVHAAIVGKGASHKLWQQIAAGRSGRVASPRTINDARGFAFVVTRSAQTPRVDNLRITEMGAMDATGATGATGDKADKADKADIVAFPNRPTSLYRGDSFVAVMRSSAERAPTSVTIEGTYAGEPFKQTLQVMAPAAAPLLAQRWASASIDELQQSGGDKDTIVTLSKDFGVMSKHTSLLVLESEEAYRQHGIERRRMLAQNSGNPDAPQVTGGDLESLGEREASLSPDHIQPGDPEIRIPAPSDARSVVVVFPFGDTKLAHFDDDSQSWIVRFLIDKDTPDGKYLVVINVTHADGRVESLELPYFVDTSAPLVKLSLQKRGKGFIVTAEQRVTRAEMVAMGVDQRGSLAGKAAEILSDARRVELWLPSGETLSLSRKRPGVFRRRWRLSEPLTEAAIVRVVVTDEAHNQNVFHVRVHPDGTSEVVTDPDAAPAVTDAPPL